MTEFNKGRIVYIEDDPALIGLVTMILKQEKYEVYGAYSGQEGIALIQDIMPDLILLDLRLPDTDGWEIHRYLQTAPELRDIPVIVLSAQDRPVDVAYGEHVINVRNYLTKPFLPDELRTIVAETLVKS